MKNSVKDSKAEVFRKVVQADAKGWLEEEIRIVCDTYNLDETNDRNEIRMIIAEQKYNET